jgi:protocatechuate 3,4-dioxygenase beta subunit
MPVYAVEGGELPVIIPQESSTVVESQTCSSCGKAAHDGACETTESTDSEVVIPTTEVEKECTCPTVDSGEVTHTEGCPQYIAPEYQCPLCKDERLDEHVDGICPLNTPVLTKMQLFTAKTTVMTEQELRDAIAAAPTDGTATTIKLGATFSITESVIINEGMSNRNIVLDLNGYTLSSSSVSTLRVYANGRLEIIDTSTDADGVVSSSGLKLPNKEQPAFKDNFYTIESSGTVKISGGTVMVNDEGWAAIYMWTGTVEVVDGTVSSSGSGKAISNGYTSSGVVNISGGTVSAPSFAINNQGTVNITGGTVTVSGAGETITNSYTGVVNVSGGEVAAPNSSGRAIRCHNGGIVNITDGTVTSSNYAIDARTAGEEVNISGGTIDTVMAKNIKLSGNPTLSIDLGGMENNQISIIGELTGADGGIRLNGQYGISSTLTVIATATTPEHAVVEKFALDNSAGRSLVKNGANIEILKAPSLITNAADLITAITNASSTGSTTIKLGNNFSVSSSANIIDKNIIVDLNGFTLSSAINTFTLNGTASLEIKDTSTGENGMLSSSGGSTVFNNGSGTVKVSSGMVSSTGDNKKTIFNNESGTVNVTGGTVTATGGSSMAIFNNESGTVNVTGGTVTAPSDNSVAILNNASGTVNVTGGTVTATGNGSDVYAINNLMDGTVNISGGTIGKVRSIALNLSGNPALTVYLLTLIDNRVNIIGELTGAEGSITLDATGLPATVTVVATATTPEHAVAEKFNLQDKKLVKNGANIEIAQANPTVWDGTLPTANPAYTFSGGDGKSENTAYQIANSYDLAMLAANTNAISSYSGGKYFKQTADVVLNSTISSSAKQWTPIGSHDNSFSGTYDGSGYTISGLYIYDKNIYTGQAKALFGYARNASIKNVGIINSEFTGAADVGSLVAISVKSIVENCYNTGAVAGELYIGGLIAQNEGVIKNCYNTGNVTAATRSTGGCVGGVVGLAHIDTEVTNCVYLGTSIIGYNAGRIASPYTTDKLGAFNNCYARSDMTINGAAVSGGTATNTNGKDLVVSSSTTQDWNTWFKGSTAWNYPTAKLIVGAILPTLKGTSSAQVPTLPGGGPAGPAITINAQPQDVSVMLGKTASFSISAAMSPAGTLSYQWYKSTSNSAVGGALISGATGTSYTTPTTTAAGMVYYYCVVSGGGVQTVSNIACMTVHTPTMNISGVVYDTNGTSPVSGAKVKLTPAAGSTEQTTGADGKYSFLNIPIGSYTISVTFSDGTKSSIVVTNTNGGDVHADDIPKPAPITIITTQPQNVSILQNKSASFTIAASVSNGASVTYQWYSNSTNSTAGGGLISGATSATYTPATATVGTTYYYCVVSSANAASVTSRIASLTVRKTVTITGTVTDKDGKGIKDATVQLIPNAGTPNPATTDSDGKYIFSDVPDGSYTIIASLPNGGVIKKNIAVPGDAGKDIEINQPNTPVIAITTQPNDTTVLKNKAATFAVEAGASNGAAITYQWYSNSKGDTSGGSLVSGATQASYTPATSVAGTNYYYCVISSKDMTSVTSRIARLTVRNTSTISGVVKDKNGAVIKDATVKLIPDVGTPNPITTDSNGNYKLDDVPDGDYTIVVELPDGSTINKEITAPDNGGLGGNIQQPVAPAITVIAQPNNVTVALNDTATFTVTASASSGTLAYQWYKNTTNSVSGGAPISGANAASYNPSTDAKGESYYYCVLNATGATPVTTGVAKLTVRNTITGTTITGTVKDKADKPVQDATVTITDKTNPSNKHITTTDADGNYTFTGVPDGDYLIIVTLPAPNGGTISGGNITVTDGTPTNSIEIKQPTVPTVTMIRQPQDTSVTVGTPSSFTVVAGASSGTIAYQWYYSSTNSTKNGTKIKNGIAATYAPATTKAGEYYYYCVASAGDASTVSNVAKLTVTTASATAGTVEGNVTDGTTHALLAGVEIRIMKGGTDGTQFGDTITTGAEGKFEFIAIPYGSYSLVAMKDGQTITKQINIKSSHIVENLVMVSGNKDTKVEIKGDAPSVAAENLTEMFTDEDDRLSTESSAKVEIKLVVEKLDNLSESEDDLVNAIVLERRNSIVGLYLDAKLLKTITGMGIKNISNKEIQPPDGQRVRIVLDLPTHMRGKSDYLVVQVHEAKTRTITPVYDSILNTLAFDADKFSTYTIIYTSADSAKGGSSGRGNSSSTDAFNFWETVESKIITVAQGDTVKVNAKSYDKMPVSVMDALSNKGVTLVISWNGGEDIYILAGAAQKSDVNRIYYPLSLLAQLYKDAKVSEIVQVVQGGNPETGGVGYTHDDYGKLIPMAGGIWELEASTVAENGDKLNAITPSNGGFEKDAFMPDSDGTNTAQNSNNVAKVAGLVALLATISCVVLVLKKKRVKSL